MALVGRRRRLPTLLLLGVAGCLAPTQPWQERVQDVAMGGGPSDTTYLLHIDPVAVESGGAASLAERAGELERRYVRHVEVDGVVWQPLRSSPSIVLPDRYGTGGDSMLFTGIALAGWTWKYAVTGDSDRVIEAVRGLWILTHVAGRGVLCRAAFPSSRDVEFGWPEAWADRDPRFVGETPAGTVQDPIRGGHLPAMRWYTRATRDQITGLVLGLSSAWRLAMAPATDPTLSALIRPVVAQTVADVVLQLRANEWQIRDDRGRNDTSADDVDGLLRLAVLGLARAVGLPNADRDYQREFGDFAERADALGAFDRYNNVQQYYAYGLRAARSYSIWLLDEDPEHKALIVDYAETHWRRWTDHHGNAWLAWLWFVMAGIPADEEGLRALHELRWKPIRLWSSPLAGRWKPPSFDAATLDTTAAWVLPVYLRKPTAYSVWQKAPWDAGDPPWDRRGLGDSTGVDFLAAYWLGRANGFIAR
jgi:hypothetical protein